VKRLAAIVVAAGCFLVAPVTAAADEPWTYKNPAQPSKNPDDLKDSQYRGWHYEKKWESYRKCVMARESGGNYKADGPYGSGAYQFIQSTWDEAMRRARKPEWVGVRPHKAPPAYQDEAFFLMANPYPKLPGLQGRHHWSSRWAKEVLGVNVKDC
jgi:hypothetical protein